MLALMLALIFLILDIWRYMRVYEGICRYTKVYGGILKYMGIYGGGCGAAAGELMPSELYHKGGMRT